MKPVLRLQKNYAHLHIHSEYSILDGMAVLQDIFEKAKRLNLSAVSITDHANLDAYVNALKYARQYQVKYIPATELYVSDVTPDKNVKFSHLVIYAKNMEGLSVLMKVLGKANDFFYRRPVLSLRQLSEFDCKDLMFATACMRGMSYNQCQFILDNISDDLFFEVMPHDVDEQRERNKDVVSWAKYFGKTIIATNDTHYLNQEDKDTHEVLLAINSNSKMSDTKRFKFEIETCYMPDKVEFEALFQKQGQFMPSEYKTYIANTNEVVKRVSDDFGYFSHKLKEAPDFKMQVLKQFEKMPFAKNRQYIERLERELKLIHDKGVEQYFQIVADFVSYAKSKNILMSPSRGSVGGCLVAYVLGITQVDPIKFDLPFERFMAEHRVDLPDIDLDFEDIRRDEVILYLKQKYGSDAVVNISTFIDMKSKAVIRDVSRVFDIPLYEVNTVSKALDEVMELNEPLSSLFVKCKELSDFCDKYNITEHCKKLEGVIKAVGIHAAGCIVNDIEHINDTGRGYIAKRNNKPVLNWDKDSAEKMGFLKFDILGLNTLTVLSKCIEIIKAKGKKPFKRDLSDIDLNDDRVLDIFRNADTVGVFQFASYGMRQLLKSISIHDFNDLVVLNALYRPGVLRSGLLDEYKIIKSGKKRPILYSEEYAKITKDTCGIIVFQEQLTKVLEVFGFTYEEADKMRKIMAKSKGEQAMEVYRSQFIEKSGLYIDIANELFDKIVFFGGYAFNKAHATSYAMLAYQTAYFKCYFYDEFMQALLTYGSDSKLQEYLDDLVDRGYIVSNIKLNHSKAKEWVIKDNQVFLPFSAIKGIGDVTSALLEDVGSKCKSFEDLQTIANKKALNSRVLGLLERAGVFGGECDGSLFRINIRQFSAVTQIAERYNLNISKVLAIANGSILLDDKKFYTYDKATMLNKGEAVAVRKNGSKIIGIANEKEIMQCDLKGLYNGDDANIVKCLSQQDIKQLESIRNSITNCKACNLRAECKQPVGSDYVSNVVVLGEAPGIDEDRQGRAFVGDAGKYLWSVLEVKGFGRKYFSILNTVKCYPSVSKKPESIHINRCHNFLVSELEIIKPVLILALGATASNVISGMDVKITEMNGQCVWNTWYKCWVVYCVHPAYVLRQHSDKAKGEFNRGIESFVERVNVLI